MSPALTRIKFIVFSFLLAPLAFADLESGLLVNGQRDGAMEAGQPARLQFIFLDPMTGHPPHHFHVMHEKPMHLVVVSEDLSQFAHLHPTLIQHSHVPFDITVNKASTDPDNFALSSAVPKPGHYFLFGEIMPMDYSMLIFPFDLKVNGESKGPAPSVVPDPLSPDGTILKFYGLDSLESGPLQANYQLKILPEAVDHCGTLVPKLNVELSFRENPAGEFLPVTDLEPWLASYGHSFVISKNGANAADRSIVHLHAVWPLIDSDPKDGHGPWLELAAHSHGNSFPPGIYRAWVQIKHRGQVLTLPLTFDWNPAAPSVQSFCDL